MRKFKLLKDIYSMDLTAKAGEIGELMAGGRVWFDNNRYYYPIEKVEQYAEWFSEVKEPTTGLIGVSIKGNVVDYESTASIKLDEQGLPTAIAMNGKIFLPEPQTSSIPSGEGLHVPDYLPNNPKIKSSFELFNKAINERTR